MRRGFAIGVILFFLAGCCYAQLGASPERAAMTSLHKKKWEKAAMNLRKAMRRDSINALAEYIWSLYFFTQDNPAGNPDSAYHHIRKSLKHFEVAGSRIRDKMKRFPLDSTTIISLRERIDSAAFQAAKAINTESAYIRFLEGHPFAPQRQQAIELCNEVAYLDAVQKNTHEAFLDFLNKYPLAPGAPEARKKYDRLLYESRTAEATLPAYESFLRDHPETPFRNEIEKNIFELFTLSGEVERYLSFIQRYPDSEEVKKAQNIIFHLLQDQEGSQMEGLFLNDSLRKIRQLQENYLVPFYKNHRFGFIDKNGAEIIPPTIDHLNEEYKCGNIAEDIIVTGENIIARDGTVIFAGKVEEMDDMGIGFLKLRSGNCTHIVHKSGFSIDDCAEDLKILANRFLAILKDQRWSIVTLTGRVLLEDWEEVTIHNNVLALKKDKQWRLLTLNKLAEFAETHKLSLSDAFDDLKMLPDGLILVRSGEREGILKQDLTDLIAQTGQSLTPSFFGYIARSADGFSIYDKDGHASSHFDSVNIQEPWTAVRKNGQWHLFDPVTQQYEGKTYDSLAYDGPFLFGFNADTLTIHFAKGISYDFIQPVTANFIPGKDSTFYLATASDRKKTVYNHKGKILFNGVFDQVQYAGEDLFIVSKKEKKGLVNSRGKLLLPVEYDAIGSVINGVVSLLRNMKFGLYNAEENKLIKPKYDKNLIPYTGQLIAAYQNGLYGFIDWDNKPKGIFEFEEITYWNDTAALARKDKQWLFYHIAQRSAMYSGIREINLIKNSADEKLAIVQQGNLFGVLSNKKGIVIPVTFTDLVNLGSAEEPLYFTEKHVTEASVFVVIYYDKNGGLLRREVYQETEDYEKIYCPDK